ncbi:hypothetical protein [Halosimplex pelagicum]|uniref:DUF8055 domain-containing protein n=1 Tax=Halosimplex pelagicum TaxID=869886 RepID=A0A7D5PC63_9EURY|nr:hypothetical protein [Halosimplex pelagicum]QLH84384.1 hypothetical protein HZS54_23295 [Halosimplex pelagicum]
MPSKYRDRIDELADEAAAARESFDPPADPPDEERAVAVCREGVGEAVAVYVDARSGEWDRFGEAEFERLERALNTYLELYARCYGVEITADRSVRTAAEALLDTHDIADVARILTGVPDRDAE